ncbi:MAG: hypothetical protein EPO23_10200 [Xanthobacteraceae bacterium]|nr:MAG: hypothetical protein EPO23_10200 [Xanthobacteraceae bacterium]
MKRPADALTIDLFDIPRAPAPTGGSLDYSVELAHALSEALKKSPKSRYEIAARMSELVGHEIGKATLDAWTAESKTGWRFPFEYAAAFEAACETTCLQELLCRKRGSRILEGEEALLAELGRLDRDEQAMKQRRQAIRKYLGAKR